MERCEAPIVVAPRGGAYVEVPGPVADALRCKRRIAVCATFDGIAYRGSIVSMEGIRVLGLLKNIRSELGTEPGDVVSVTVAADPAERSVDLPEDLRRALRDAGVVEACDALSYTHRREHVKAIEDAKQASTRARRISQTIDRVQG